MSEDSILIKQKLVTRDFTFEKTDNQFILTDKHVMYINCDFYFLIDTIKKKNTRTLFG